METYFIRPASQKNNTIFFDINSLQWLTENKEPDHERQHCNNQYEILWITEGCLYNCMDMQQTESIDNRLFLIRPGQMHRYSLSGEAKGYSVNFTEAFLDMEDQRSDGTYYNSLFRLFSGPEGTRVDKDLTDDLEDILQRLMKEFTGTHLFRTEILRRYFKIFLIYLARQFEENFSETWPTRNAELVQKFMASLDKKFKTHKMVSDYAAELLVTPNYLNEIIKKMTGFSAGHHIRNRVVLEAKRLARYSGICMKEIAYSLGFSDSAHFSKFFKSVTGMNFSEFKKEKQLLLSAI
ncbi:MAG: helix-turn-helix transcriptional regulator [Bacteroidota bacterium]